MDNIKSLNLDRHIDDRFKRESKKKKVGVYYPSTVVQCIRKAYYSYINPKELSIDTVRIFEIGNIIHSFAADTLKTAGYASIVEERSVALYDSENNFVVSGRLDDLIKLPINGKEYVIEVKSTKDVNALIEPKYEHVLQLHPYLKIQNIDSGIIWYIDKSTLKSKDFVVNFSEEIFQKFMDRCRVLNKCLKNNEVPYAENWNDTNKCGLCREKYCQYYFECQNDGTKI